MQYRPSPAQKWFIALVNRTLSGSLSTRSGSLLSGETGGAGTRLDLNRQMTCTNDPQGMYIAGADGTSYGFTNDHDPPDIRRFMDTGLKRFRLHPPRRVTVTEQEQQASFSIHPPAKASVLRVYSRIRPVPAGVTPLNEGVGRDYCWVYQDEVKALATATGQTFPLPTTLVRRIARFHLLDNVRGTPDMWRAGDVKDARFTGRVVREVNGVRTLAFDGTFALRTASGGRGYEGRIEGQCEVDARTLRLGRFRALATGKAWGVGTFTPNAPKGRFPLLIALLDTDEPIARIVPPEEVVTANNDRAYRRP